MNMHNILHASIDTNNQASNLSGTLACDRNHLVLPVMVACYSLLRGLEESGKPALQKRQGMASMHNILHASWRIKHCKLSVCANPELPGIEVAKP
jgi:hypothetical protein